MVVGARSTVAAACVALLLVASRAGAQTPVLSPATVSGTNISFTWSATAGATSYRLDAGLAPGSYVASLPVGTGTSFAVTAPAIGVYYARVVALTPTGDVASNEITISVTTLVAPPAAPTDLAVARNGQGIVVTWTPGTGGSPATGYRLIVGLPQGGSAVLNLATPSFAYAPVPAGAYTFRVAAVNAGGASAETADTPMTMPPGGACDVPPTPTLRTSAWGNILTASWTPVPGASTYLLSYDGAGLVGQAPFGGTTTQFTYRGLPTATWQFGIQATFSCGAQSAVGASTLVMDNSTLRLQPRAADPTGPTPPNYLPLPNRASLVEQLAAQYPGEMRNSCGRGRHQFLFRLVNRLRQEDKRWGLNWKRNNFGDMSEDVITYNYGSEADEGTRQVHVVDIIAGHCGPNPGPAWINQTVLFSTGATWTLVPLIEAGYTP